MTFSVTDNTENCILRHNVHQLFKKKHTKTMWVMQRLSISATIQAYNGNHWLYSTWWCNDVKNNEKKNPAAITLP